VADGDGRWSVCLEPLPACADPADIEVSSGATTIARDVVVGDVWLASGQSNMEFTVKGARDAAKEMAAADFPLIRHIKVGQAVATSPVREISSAGWESAAPGTVGEFTAVGFFFAREVHARLRVPLGILHSSWGGTPIESWMSDEARGSTSLAEVLRARWRQAMLDWPPERVVRYPQAMAIWQEAEDRAKAAGRRNLLPWPQPPATRESPMFPGGLFNAMIAPLQPCGLRGVLWYQGESNAERAIEYAELFKAMIRDWRAGWRREDLPFYFVQIANYLEQQDATNRSWARLRDAQADALALPATGMAVAVDVGQADDVHPVNKQDVGHRLALVALAGTYGAKVDCRGPEFSGASREGGALRVRFSHDSGLVARGGGVRSLELAGADRTFHPATGRIDGKSLVVSSTEVPEPVAVRYAWVNAPDANLYNGAGLPAVPFRSDDW
jgi:sialate O-acetylesterase